MADFLVDYNFLKKLTYSNIKTTYVKIEVLDLEDTPIAEIQGKVSSGSLNINGNSGMRRTGSLTFILDDNNYKIQETSNLLSINKKIALYQGFKNNIDIKNYEPIVWFKLGVFFIDSPGISHSVDNYSISLSLKDKLVLLNGEVGGTFPAPVTFSSYKQENPDGTTTEVEQKMFDIIQTCVCNFGGIPIEKIYISDVPLQIKQSVRYVGTGTLYYNPHFGAKYTTNEQEVANSGLKGWQNFTYNDDIGYEYVDFVYPGKLVTNVGDKVTTVLDKVIEAMQGNYEYFFDVDGNFIFREKKNYLNNSYLPNETDWHYLKGDKSLWGDEEHATLNNTCILDSINAQVDFGYSGKSVFSFEEGNQLIASYSNSLQYMNIKNDFHIWGKDKNDLSIHYHVAIKDKPTVMNTYLVSGILDEQGWTSDNPNAGKIILVPNNEKDEYNIKKDIILTKLRADLEIEQSADKKKEIVRQIDFYTNKYIYEYTPKDWRAEIYMQGLSKKQSGVRPSIHEQELLDNFASIYNFQEDRFKWETANNVNNLKYFFDYLEPTEDNYEYSADVIGLRTLTQQSDKVNKLYDNIIPNEVIILNDSSEASLKAQQYCESIGQDFARVPNAIFNKLSIGVVGISAQNVMRNLLYQYVTFNESISLTAIPIYYLEPNYRITVNDEKSCISGDFIINSISLPLGNSGTMSISASKALNRI